MKYTAITITITLLLFGCVSVNIGSKKVDKSESYSFKNPKDHFEELKTDSADKAWKSKKTNNIISLLTECNSQQETSLQNIATSTHNAFSSYTSEQESLVEYNEREALQTLVNGKIDGVTVKMKSLILKKNECIYTLSYFGTLKNFEDELNIFDHFTSDFKVP